MKVNYRSIILGSIVLLLTLGFASASDLKPTTINRIANENLETLTRWFTGEFNNYEQNAEEVYARDKGGKDIQPHHHVHSIFAPVSIPALGENVFHVQQSPGDDINKVFRQRLYVFKVKPDTDTVAMKIYKFSDQKPYFNAHKSKGSYDGFDIDSLIDTECTIIWEKDGDRFVGMNEGGKCTTYSQRLQKNIVVEDTITLYEDQIWLLDNVYDEDRNLLMGREDGEPAKLRKCSFYSGWAAIKVDETDQKPDAENNQQSDKKNPSNENPVESEPESENVKKAKPKYKGYMNLELHNQGQRVTLVDENGVESGYDVTLAQVTYAGSGTAVLKLALHKTGEKKHVCYIWGEPEALRLGLNLTWIQTGFTLKPEQLFAK